MLKSNKFVFLIILFFILINIAAIKSRKKTSITNKFLNWSENTMTKWCCTWRQNVEICEKKKMEVVCRRLRTVYITSQCRRSEMKFAAKFKLAAVEYVIIWTDAVHVVVRYMYWKPWSMRVAFTTDRLELNDTKKKHCFLRVTFTVWQMQVQECKRST